MGDDEGRVDGFALGEWLGVDVVGASVGLAVIDRENILFLHSFSALHAFPNNMSSSSKIAS
jgi:hypothetical protein